MIAQKKAQYITDHAGKRVGVVLDLKTFEKMGDELDDYYCKRAYEKAKPLTDGEIKRGEFMTIEELKARRRIRKIRSHNGKCRKEKMLDHLTENYVHSMSIVFPHERRKRWERK